MSGRVRGTLVLHYSSSQLLRWRGILCAWEVSSVTDREQALKLYQKLHEEEVTTRKPLHSDLYFVMLHIHTYIYTLYL